MKKIKKFRISVRPSYFFRLLKNSVEIQKDEIEKQIQDNYSLISPCTLYESYKLEGLKNEEFRKAVESWAEGIEITPYSVVSLVIITIGGMIEKEIENLKDKDGRRQADILEALGTEALQQCHIFVTKLIQKEAEEEDCIVNGLKKVPDAELKNMVKLLDSRKIGVAYDKKTGLTPPKSVAFYAYWIPLKKKKRK